MLCKWYVFFDSHPVVVQLDITRVTESTGQNMYLGHRELEGKTCEIELGRENVVITSLEVCKSARSWIGGREIVKGTEETTGGDLCKLFRPLDDHHLVVANADAPDECVKTMCDEGRAEASKLWHGC